MSASCLCVRSAHPSQSRRRSLGVLVLTRGKMSQAMTGVKLEVHTRVWHCHVKPVFVTAARENLLATKRLLAIVESLEKEIGEGHGSKIRLAKRIGLSESVLAHIRSGNRQMGYQSMKDVCEAMGLRMEWFTEDRLPSDNWRDYIKPVARQSEDAVVVYDPLVLPVADAFLASDHIYAREMNAEQKERFRSVRLGGTVPSMERMREIAGDILHAPRVADVVVLRPGREPLKKKPKK